MGEDTLVSKFLCSTALSDHRGIVKVLWKQQMNSTQLSLARQASMDSLGGRNTMPTTILTWMGMENWTLRVPGWIQLGDDVHP